MHFLTPFDASAAPEIMKHEQDQDELGFMLSRRKRRPSLSARGRRMLPLTVRQEAPRLMLRKIRKLRKMVPGSRGLDVESLLIRTSEYISLLKWQVNALESLWSLHSL